MAQYDIKTKTPASRYTSYRKPSPMAAAPAAPIALPLKYSVWRAVLYLRIHANTPNEAIDYATEAPCQHTHTTNTNDVSRLPDRTVRARCICLLEYSEYG